MTFSLTDTWREIQNAFVLFASRLLTHFVGLGVAFSVALPPVVIGLGGGQLVQFGAYLGIICLFPKRFSRKPDWLLPTCAGLLQYGVLAFLGVPFHLAIMFAGIQTWVQRIIHNRGSMGWEWATLPWLLIAVGGTWDVVTTLGLTGRVILGMVVTGGISAAVSEWYCYVRRAALNFANCQEAVAKLKKLSETTQSLGARNTDMLFLTQQAALFLPFAQSSAPRPTALVRQLALFTESLPARDPKGKFILVGKKAETLTSLGNELEQFVLEHESKKPSAKTKELEQFEVTLAEFQQTIGRLRRKRKKLPEHTAEYLDRLCASALSIIESMRQDPKDRPGGERFLSRYLPAAEHVVEEYIRLKEAEVQDESIDAVLVKTEEVLSRLEKAFAQEYVVLLQNDTMSLSAELKALDTLLSMQGR